jgi:hypothetical protein
LETSCFWAGNKLFLGWKQRNPVKTMVSPPCFWAGNKLFLGWKQVVSGLETSCSMFLGWKQVVPCFWVGNKLFLNNFLK